VSSRISAATSECASVAGHFDGHAEALKQSMWHCLMQHVQGSSGSHWTLPLGDYSLRIAPAAALETINKTTMQNVPSLLAFLMTIAMRQYYTARIARLWRFVSFLKATKRHHWASPCSDITNRTRLPLILGVYFIVR
jgi:hypothetical protein